MSVKESAAHFIKYWFKDADNKWKVADNAPTPLVVCLRALPKNADTEMVYRVFQSLASGKTIAAPSLEELLLWVGSSPAASRRCDEILQNPAKNKVATLGALLAKAYLSECHSIVDRVHQSLAN